MCHGLHRLHIAFHVSLSHVQPHDLHQTQGISRGGDAGADLVVEGHGGSGGAGGGGVGGVGWAGGGGSAGGQPGPPAGPGPLWTARAGSGVFFPDISEPVTSRKVPAGPTVTSLTTRTSAGRKGWPRSRAAKAGAAGSRSGKAQPG